MWYDFGAKKPKGITVCLVNFCREFQYMSCSTLCVLFSHSINSFAGFLFSFDIQHENDRLSGV